MKETRDTKNSILKLAKKAISLQLIIFAIFLSSCTYIHTVKKPSIDSVSAHWIKKGQKAPFNGILINKETYRLLRSKIIECSYQLDMCLDR